MPGSRRHPGLVRRVDAATFELGQRFPHVPRLRGHLDLHAQPVEGHCVGPVAPSRPIQLRRLRRTAGRVMDRHVPLRAGARRRHDRLLVQRLRQRIAGRLRRTAQRELHAQLIERPSRSGLDRYPAFSARKLIPRVSNSAASDSCRKPENPSISGPHCTSTNPVCSSSHSHSAVSRAPAIQPDQRSMSSFASCGTGRCTTMSTICARPRASTRAPPRASPPLCRGTS